MAIGAPGLAPARAYLHTLLGPVLLVVIDAATTDLGQADDEEEQDEDESAGGGSIGHGRRIGSRFGHESSLVSYKSG